MNLEKYKNHLFKNIKNQLSEWFETEAKEEVPSAQVFRFLHSIKGTSGTLELGGLMQVSEHLLMQLQEESDKSWSKSELRLFLYELMELTYEYENFSEADHKVSSNRDQNAPLVQIIDDDVSMLILLKDVLEENGCMVMTNTDPEKATNQYFELQPDCLIIDINLPAKDGFRVLEDVQKHNEKYFIPKIMISIQNDKATRIKAYKMGADDFISKPIEIDEFAVKIERHLQRKKIFDESVLMDELTKVYNRRFLNDYIPRYFHDYKRNQQTFSLSVLDLDHFKRVNDTYGHQVGDIVLVEFAQYLKRNIRSTDMLFRFGGEEFLLLLPRTGKTEAKVILTKLIEGFSQIPFKVKDGEFHVTFSAGVFTINEDHITPEDAFNGADYSLYEAKRNGRARVESNWALDLQLKKKVLNVSVIDDDVIIRTMLENIMQSVNVKNYELNIAVYDDGIKFLESSRAKEHTNHFLILDGIMPTIDGLDVLKKIKAGENAENYTVLMLTGRKSNADIAEALKLGADDYVTKPFSIPELETRIQRLLTRLK